MAYIGQAPETGTFKKIDAIDGLQNNIRTIFPLRVNNVAYTPQTPLQLLVVKNGETLDPGEDFSVAGSNLSFPTAPLTTDNIFIVAYGTALFSGVPSDGTITNVKIVDASIEYDKLSGDAVGTIIGNIITFGI